MSTEERDRFGWLPAALYVLLGVAALTLAAAGCEPRTEADEIVQPEVETKAHAQWLTPDRGDPMWKRMWRKTGWDGTGVFPQARNLAYEFMRYESEQVGQIKDLTPLLFGAGTMHSWANGDAWYIARHMTRDFSTSHCFRPNEALPHSSYQTPGCQGFLAEFYLQRARKVGVPSVVGSETFAAIMSPINATGVAVGPFAASQLPPLDVDFAVRMYSPDFRSQFLDTHYPHWGASQVTMSTSGFTRGSSVFVGAGSVPGSKFKFMAWPPHNDRDVPRFTAKYMENLWAAPPGGWPGGVAISFVRSGFRLSSGKVYHVAHIPRLTPEGLCCVWNRELREISSTLGKTDVDEWYLQPQPYPADSEIQHEWKGHDADGTWREYKWVFFTGSQ